MLTPFSNPSRPFGPPPLPDPISGFQFPHQRVYPPCDLFPGTCKLPHFQSSLLPTFPPPPPVSRGTLEAYHYCQSLPPSDNPFPHHTLGPSNNSQTPCRAHRNQVPPFFSSTGSKMLVGILVQEFSTNGRHPTNPATSGVPWPRHLFFADKKSPVFPQGLAKPVGNSL